MSLCSVQSRNLVCGKWISFLFSQSSHTEFHMTWSYKLNINTWVRTLPILSNYATYILVSHRTKEVCLKNSYSGQSHIRRSLFKKPVTLQGQRYQIAFVQEAEQRDGVESSLDDDDTGIKHQEYSNRKVGPTSSLPHCLDVSGCICSPHLSTFQFIIFPTNLHFDVISIWQGEPLLSSIYQNILSETY